MVRESRGDAARACGGGYKGTKIGRWSGNNLLLPYHEEHDYFAKRMSPTNHRTG